MQEAALYGPAGRGEYQKGAIIRFREPQSGQELIGIVLYVRAPGRADSSNGISGVCGGRAAPPRHLWHRHSRGAGQAYDS